MWQYHPLLIVFCAGGLISLGIVLYCWRYMRQYGSSYLVGALGLMAFTNAIWSFAATLKTASESLSASIFFYKFEFAAAINPALMVVIALAYVGKDRWLNRRILGLFGGVTAAFVLLIVVNPGNVMIVDPRLLPAQGIMAFEHEFSPLFVLYLAWILGLSGLAISVMIWGTVTGRVPTKPGVATAVALSLPVGSLSMKSAGIYPPGGKGINPTPAAAAVTVGILAVVIVWYRLLDSIPVGRDRAIEVMEDGYLLASDDGRILDANPAARALLTGSEAASLKGRSIHDFVPVYDDLDAGDTVDPQFRRDGRTVAVRTSEVTRQNEDRGRVLLLQDVTRQQERQRELQRYERVVENVPVGVYRVTADLEGQLLFGNQALADILGASSVEELRDYSARDFYVDSSQREEIVDRLVTEGEITNEEVRMRTVDGEEFWASVSNARAIEAETMYFEGVLQDITERKEYEKELERAREQFRTERDGKEAIRQLLLQTSTDHEIADSVCRLLVDSYDYVAARVVRQTNSENPPDIVTVASHGEWIDPESIDGFGGHTQRALEAGDPVSVVAGTTSDDGGERLSAAGLHSIQSVPIERDGLSYGVLTVARSEPATEFTRSLVDEVADAIAFKQQVQQQRDALTAESVVELVVQFIGGHFLTELVASIEGDVTLEVHEFREDDGLVTYMVRASAVDADTLQAAASALEGVEESVIIADGSDPAVLRIRVKPPTVGTTLADYGGAIQSMAASGTEVELTVHFPRGTQIREAIERLQENWPTATMRTHNERSVDKEYPAVFEQLTEKQEEALRAATLSGFFDRPQQTSATDVAETLGVTHTTFLYHVRKAEQKIFTAAFADAT